MDYQYLNKFIDLEVDKSMRHHKFNNDKNDWYIFLSRIWGPGMCRELDPDPVQNRTGSATLVGSLCVYSQAKIHLIGTSAVGETSHFLIYHVLFARS
jgi:hypothetical protein